LDVDSGSKNLNIADFAAESAAIANEDENLLTLA
jgi:hypothetical protein